MSNYANISLEEYDRLRDISRNFDKKVKEFNEVMASDYVQVTTEYTNGCSEQISVLSKDETVKQIAKNAQSKIDDLNIHIKRIQSENDQHTITKKQDKDLIAKLEKQLKELHLTIQSKQSIINAQREKLTKYSDYINSSFFSKLINGKPNKKLWNE